MPCRSTCDLVEAVEMAGPQHNLVGAAADGLEVGAGLLFAVDLVGAGEEHRLDPVHVLHGAEQVVGEDLGAAGMEARVVVADEQDAGDGSTGLATGLFKHQQVLVADGIAPAAPVP